MHLAPYHVNLRGEIESPLGKVGHFEFIPDDRDFEVEACAGRNHRAHINLGDVCCEFCSEIGRVH